MVRVMVGGLSSGRVSPAGGVVSKTDDMKLAFTWHVSQQLIAADGVVTSDEKSWLRVRYALRARDRGLMFPDGKPTAAYQVLLDAALKELPALPREERLELVDDVIDTILADGLVQHQELEKLREIGTQLGLGGPDLDEVFKKRKDL
jgi:uncharacterized tellurite resistance protein B-like protein